MSSGVRQRRRQNVAEATEADGERTAEAGTKEPSGKETVAAAALQPGSFWLTRVVLLRFLAFVYFVAFWVALDQNVPLLGKNGLLPVPLYLDRIRRHAGSTVEAAKLAPTIFWLFDYHQDTDRLLMGIAAAGMVLSGFVMLSGAANMPLMAALWVLYQSLVNVGQRWYSFGWESQLLETGFLAIFLCPLLSLRQIPKKSPTSFIVIFAYRWLIFRIMIGAGLIKVRGDKCWRDLTCMNYHYQTQPVPNPMAYFMHQEPEIMHKFETLVNHFVELLAPWLLLLPRRLAMAGGVVQIVFQLVLIISGNLSFLNWLTILPSLACFDDLAYRRLFSIRTQALAAEAEVFSKTNVTWGRLVRRCFNAGLGLTLLLLSVPVVQNLLSSRQRMNFAFSSLRLVNTYGAFGSVTKERTEIILQGTRNAHPAGALWLDYEFKCKPGAVDRRPCLISPFHYRLDWLMWFAAFQDYQHNEWLVHLAAKLLANDARASSLLASNPFAGGPPPRWIRAEHFRYNFSAIGGVAAHLGHWWTRQRVGAYLPPVNLGALDDYLRAFGWPVPDPDAR